MVKRRFNTIFLTTAIMLLFAALFACAPTHKDSYQSALETASAPALDQNNICKNGVTYAGCCSGKGGILAVKDSRVWCKDGDQSPTCKANLQGCCSRNGGIDIDELTDAVICRSGKPSPACSCNKA